MLDDNHLFHTLSFRGTVTVSKEARAPVRIDLAGGWTDCPPFCHDVGGDVVNIAINQYARAKLTIDENGMMNCQYSCDVPIGSGLGSTGALNVALMSVIKGEEDVAEIAFQFEKLLGNRGGRQDQWAAKNGGIQHLKFIGDYVESFSLHPPTSFLRWFKKHFILADTGIRHVSGNLHASVWERYDEVLPIMMQLREAAKTMAESVQNDRRDNFVQSMKDTTHAVGLLGKEFNEPYLVLDEMPEILAWKGMGAAAGGFVGIISRNPDKTKSQLDWEILDWDYDTTGLVMTDE